MKRSSKNTLSWVLGIVFVVSLLMGPGPGVLLVNRLETILGLPAIYAWGLLWFGVMVGVVITCYFTVWSDDDSEESSNY